MENIYLLQPSSRGKLKFIHLSLDGCKVHRLWGLCGGKTQHTSNTYGVVNAGKANEKSPEQAAADDFAYITAKKIKEGYTSVTKEQFDDAMAGDDVTIGMSESGMDFDNPPSSTTVSKPVAVISDDRLDELLSEPGRAVVTAKENGHCHYVIYDSKGEPRLFSRRMIDITAKFPELMAEFRSVAVPNSMLSVELVARPKDGASIPHLELFKTTGSILKADTVHGKPKKDMPKTQKYLERYSITATVLACYYYAGEKIVSVRESFSRISAFIPEGKSSIRAMDIMSSARSAKGLRASVNIASDAIEGAVVWDMASTIEVSFTGKPKRMGGYKVKPRLEADVVVTGYEDGRGRRQGKVGALKISEMVDGELVPRGTVGSGLTKAQTEPEWWEGKIPCVIAVEFASRFTDTQAFQHPVFVKVHEDKTVEDL